MNFDTAWAKMEERAVWDFANKELSATVWITYCDGCSASLTAKYFFKQSESVKATIKRAFEKYYARGREEIINGITSIEVIVEGAEDGRKKDTRITA